MAKRVADVVVEILQEAGVKRCWGVPGDTLNFVTDAIRRSHIEWVHVRHEEAAELARIAGVLNAGARISIYGGSGCESAHDQLVALADCLKAPAARPAAAPANRVADVSLRRPECA
jgi:thiamine pyrophosphate-dependent acetolactate synthase large subunit-like protein